MPFGPSGMRGLYPRKPLGPQRRLDSEGLGGTGHLYHPQTQDGAEAGKPAAWVPERQRGPQGFGAGGGGEQELFSRALVISALHLPRSGQRGEMTQGPRAEHSRRERTILSTPQSGGAWLHPLPPDPVSFMVWGGWRLLGVQD